MIVRFLFESIVGAVSLVAIITLGKIGYVAFAVFALLPLIMRLKKIRPDERECQLFYQTGNLAMAFTILAIMIIYYASNFSLNGHTIGELWMPLSIASLLMIHGISGLIIFRPRWRSSE